MQYIKTLNHNCENILLIYISGLQIHNAWQLEATYKWQYSNGMTMIIPQLLPISSQLHVSFLFLGFSEAQKKKILIFLNSLPKLKDRTKNSF